MKRALLTLALLAVIVVGALLLRPGPSIALPDFDGGRREASVRNGVRREFRYEDAPWRDSVTRLGSILESRGYVRIAPGTCAWKRGDEEIAAFGRGDGKRMTRLGGVIVSRPATAGESFVAWVRGRLRR